MFESIEKREYEADARARCSHAVSVVCGIASAADKPAAVDPAYQQSFEKWKGDLVEDLKQEWLPLAGLFWLKPGENSFRH